MKVNPATGHRCEPYTNVRGERINPADQGGIGCPVCYWHDGRFHAASGTGGTKAVRLLPDGPAAEGGTPKLASGGAATTGDEDATRTQPEDEA